MNTFKESLLTAKEKVGERSFVITLIVRKGLYDELGFLY